MPRDAGCRESTSCDLLRYTPARVKRCRVWVRSILAKETRGGSQNSEIGRKQMHGQGDRTTSHFQSSTSSSESSSRAVSRRLFFTPTFLLWSFFS